MYLFQPKLIEKSEISRKINETILMNEFENASIMPNKRSISQNKEVRHNYKLSSTINKRQLTDKSVIMKTHYSSGIADGHPTHPDFHAKLKDNNLRRSISLRNGKESPN